MTERIWFTSDTHFGHKNILRFCPNTRLGNDENEMTEILIANWQKQVGQNDRVYILGDVFFCNYDRAISIMDRLPGQKFLVYGNHDNVIRNNKTLRDKFVSVSEYKEIDVNGRKIVMFHYPMLEWNRMHYGAYALFGHVHGNMDHHPEILSARIMDVGVDSRPNYVVPNDGPMTLWSFDQISTILEARPIRSHHGKYAQPTHGAGHGGEA